MKAYGWLAAEESTACSVSPLSRLMVTLAQSPTCLKLPSNLSPLPFNGPGSSQTDGDPESFRGVRFVLKPLLQSIEVSHVVICEMVLFHPRQQTTKQVVDPAAEIRIGSSGNLDTHIRCGQSGHLECPVENQFHIHVRSGALKRLMDKRCAPGPQGQMSCQPKKRTPACFLN